MDYFSFVFTIFFLLLGPVKIIPAFAGLTRGAEDRFKRSVAIRAALIASAVAAFVALAGETLVGRYNISIDALRIAGGLVLLLAALNTIFSEAKPSQRNPGNATALQLAASPMATPVIVPPAGVAAILIFIMQARQYPQMALVGICLAIVMAMDFLVMYFIDRIVKARALMLALQVLGQVLVFIQVALAAETILVALKHLGVIPGRGAP